MVSSAPERIASIADKIGSVLLKMPIAPKMVLSMTNKTISVTQMVSFFDHRGNRLISFGFVTAAQNRLRAGSGFVRAANGFIRGQQNRFRPANRFICIKHDRLD